MTGSFRTATGGVVKRDKTLSFTFDGERYQGLEGDTLASALLANGVVLMGRSFKYHRPRGVGAAGSNPRRGRPGARRRPASIRRPSIDSQARGRAGPTAEGRDCRTYSPKTEPWASTCSETSVVPRSARACQVPSPALVMARTVL